MAPLPFNNTAVYTLTYTNGLDLHSVSVRYDDLTATVTDAAQAIGGLFLEMESSLWSGFRYVEARNLERGSNFSLPALLPVPAPTPGTVAIQEINTPQTLTFVGRSQGGRRNVLPLYALGIAIPQDYLFTRNENAVLDAGLDYLQGLGGSTLPAGTMVAIDGTDTIWYDRITVTLNDYWVRQARR